MNHYVVISPEYESYPFDGINPPEYGCDVVYIHAENRRDAKSFALRAKEMEGWLIEAQDCQINPFSGLKVEESICPHGVCYCGCNEDECKECMKEFEDDSNKTEENI